MSAAPSADDGERGAMPAAKDYSEALARGLRILTIFGEDTPSLTLAEIARLIGLPRATTRRALITLVHLGYMEEDRRRFHLRPRVLDLAAAYLRASPAIAILQPACERLAAAHGETFSVAVLDGRHAARYFHVALRVVRHGDAPRGECLDVAVGHVDAVSHI